MLEPEYRVGLRVLTKELGLWSTLKVVATAAVKSLRIHYETDESLDVHDRTKAQIKNHFKLLSLMDEVLRKQHGSERTDEVMHKVLIKGGQAFVRGFTPLGADDDLRDFARVYRDFERHNIVFDVVEETTDRFEITIKRCLVYESFNELGIGSLTQWMCDIAFAYFNSYHPQITYFKDRMIARGDKTCHEVFVWHE